MLTLRILVRNSCDGKIRDLVLLHLELKVEDEDEGESGSVESVH